MVDPEREAPCPSANQDSWRADWHHLLEETQAGEGEHCARGKKRTIQDRRAERLGKSALPSLERRYLRASTAGALYYKPRPVAR